jgi:5-methylcytosine-specific restriction protein A
MPVAAMRPCRNAPRGCRGLARKDFCDACRDAGARVDTRPSAAQRGYGYRWQKYSKEYLWRHPVCVDPQRRHVGLAVPSAVTDHVIPHKGDEQLMWDESNHQALCKGCHDHKTATLDGGFGPAPVR